MDTNEEGDRLPANHANDANKIGIMESGALRRKGRLAGDAS